MLLDPIAHALAEALEHDTSADYVHIPTSVVAEWLGHACPHTGVLPRAYTTGKRQRKPEDERRFARSTAHACLNYRWVTFMGEQDTYKITAAGRAALQRFVFLATPRHERMGVA